MPSVPTVNVLPQPVLQPVRPALVRQANVPAVNVLLTVRMVNAQLERVHALADLNDDPFLVDAVAGQVAAAAAAAN